MCSAASRSQGSQQAAVCVSVCRRISAGPAGREKAGNPRRRGAAGFRPHDCQQHHLAWIRPNELQVISQILGTSQTFNTSQTEGLRAGRDGEGGPGLCPCALRESCQGCSNTQASATTSIHHIPP